jgi:proline racemase
VSESTTIDAINGVYVHDGSAYVLARGRVFVGPEDPTADGFTMADGDIWEDTTS